MKIGIVGLGLIGGTIAKSLNANHKISGYDRSRETIEYAIENNIIDKSYTDLSSFFSDNDVFFICLYPNDIINFIFKNKDLIPKSKLLIEISGIKKYLIDRIEEFGPLNFDIVFTHPIAGSEKVGIKYSKASIFKNANFVISPVESNKKKNIMLVKDLAEEMGFRNISIVTPEEHDDLIAYTSQLTHVLSLSLVNAISTGLDTSRFIGDSYRDLTRISMINDRLWPELFIYNKDALVRKVENFEAELRKVKDAIKMNDWRRLTELMQKSTSIRLAMEQGKKDES